DDLVGGAGERRHGRHVDADSEGASARSGDLRGHFPGLGLLDVGHRDRHSFNAETQRNAAPDPASTACHDGDASVQIVDHDYLAPSRTKTCPFGSSSWFAPRQRSVATTLSMSEKTILRWLGSR